MQFSICLRISPLLDMYFEILPTTKRTCYNQVPYKLPQPNSLIKMVKWWKLIGKCLSWPQTTSFLKEDHLTTRNI